MSEGRELPGTLRCQGGGRPVSTCLKEDEILAFVQGLWEQEHLGRLHEHLDQCETCQRLVTEAAHALNSGPVLDVDPVDSTFQRNTVIGQRYLILRFIAQGGMGEVYEAYDRHLRERVALKTLPFSVGQSSHAVQRLRAEAQLARRVSHPNVCRIYDLGSHSVEPTGGVIHFLTMEFVPGETLGQRIRSGGALPVEQALKVARQLLLGLSAAHRAGILHRDFKSDNIMLRPEANGESSPVIMDFGLARALERDVAYLTTGRNHGLVGTIAYMAPEQIENKPLTTASDVYSFGISWFEMLTGKLPFAGSSSAVTALERFRRSPPPPSTVNPQVPRSLDPVVLRCLSLAPENRFSTPDDVLRALESFEHRSATGQSTRARRKQLVGLAGVGLVAAGFFSFRSVLQRSGGESSGAGVATVLTASPPDPNPPPSAPAAVGAEPLESPAASTSKDVAAPQDLTDRSRAAAPRHHAVESDHRPPSAVPNAAAAIPGAGPFFGYPAPAASAASPNAVNEPSTDAESSPHTGETAPRRHLPDWEDPFQPSAGASAHPRPPSPDQKRTP